VIRHQFHCRSEWHAYACSDELLANGWAVEKIMVLPWGGALVYAHQLESGEVAPSDPVPIERVTPDQEIGHGLTAQELHDGLQQLFAED